MMDYTQKLEQEVIELRARVRKNPWPWLAGGLVIGAVIGAVLF